MLTSRHEQFVAAAAQLFGSLSAEALAAIEPLAEWVHLVRGDALFRQGDASDGLYVVVSGRLQVVRTNGDGTAIVLSEVPSGESIGEMGFFTREPRTADVIAVRDTLVVKFSLDKRHRCYSQGVFASDDEPLEDAMTRKMDFAIEAAGIRPGMRVLDIGGGWGAFFEYGGRKGVQVTSLTISKESEAFLRELGERERLPSRVVREHLYEHRAEPYDAIVNMGVTEHLPDYPETLKH